MTPATPTAAAPIRQRIPSYSSSSARSDNPRPRTRLRLPSRPRAASMSAEARPAPSPVPPPAHPTYDLSAVIALALSEDAGDRGDVSCLATIPTDVKAEATFIAKEDGVIAGISLAEMIFNQVDPSLKVEWFEADGNYVRKGLQFGKVYGCAQSIIVAERVVLNFMQRMSATAPAPLVKPADGGGGRRRSARRPQIPLAFSPLHSTSSLPPHPRPNPPPIHPSTPPAVPVEAADSGEGLINRRPPQRPAGRRRRFTDSLAV